MAKDLEEQIKEAKQLLVDNGYVVKRWTESMEADAKKCEESDFNKDCAGCSCSQCLMHG